MLRQRDKGFNRSIYQVKFDLDIVPRPPFFNNLSVINKGKEDGRITSVVWSPKYNKYVGFFIANKNIAHNLKDYSINDKVTFDIVEIN